MNLEKRLCQLSSNLNNLLRYGKVVDVDTKRAKIRVQMGEIKTPWIAWIGLMAGVDKSWRAPSIGEYALVLSPGGNVNLAVALVGIYYDKFPAPEKDSGIHSITYSDGTKISYDKKTKQISVNSIGSVSVKAQKDVTVETQGCASVVANQGVSINSTSPISISTSSTVTIGGAAGVSINAPGIEMNCSGNANMNCDGNVNLSANEINLGGQTAIARVGDTVEVQVTGGSSAGTYSGTITSGSNKVKVG